MRKIHPLVGRRAQIQCPQSPFRGAAFFPACGGVLSTIPAFKASKICQPDFSAGFTDRYIARMIFRDFIASTGVIMGSRSFKTASAMSQT